MEPFRGNLSEIDQRKPIPTRPEDVILRPQRTPADIAKNCVSPLAPLAIAATKGEIGPAEIAAAGKQIRDAIEAAIQRERDEAARAAIVKPNVDAIGEEVET